MSDTLRTTVTEVADQLSAITEVQQEIVSILSASFKVEPSENGFCLIKQGKYSIKFTLSELDMQLERPIDIINPPLDFLRAIEIYENLPEYVTIDAYNNGKKELNWSTPLHRLLSHLWLIQKMHLDRSIKKVIFMDSTKYVIKSGVNAHLKSHGIKNLHEFDHFVIAYNYRNSDYSGIYGDIPNTNFIAVSNYEIKATVGTISSIIHSLYPDRSPTTVEQKLIDTFNDQSFPADVLQQMCGTFQIGMVIQADRLLCNYEHMQEVQIDADNYNCKLADQTKQLIRTKLNEVNCKTTNITPLPVPFSSDDKLVPTSALEFAQQSNEPKPSQPITKEEIKKKYDLTDQQFSTLDLYLTLPQTSPDTFNLDQIINQIKNNIGTGWQLLLQKHTKPTR